MVVNRKTEVLDPRWSRGRAGEIQKRRLVAIGESVGRTAMVSALFLVNLLGPG